MRIDHRAVADVSTRIDEHRRHAHDVASDVAAIANARSTGNDAHAIGSRKMPHRVSILVKEWLLRGIHRHIHGGSHAEAHEDSLFYPRVGSPAGRMRSAGLRGANAARVQLFLVRAKKLVVFLGVARGLRVKQRFDLLFELVSCGWQREPFREARAIPARCESSRDFPCAAARAAGGTRVRAAPFPPWPLSRALDSSR